MDNIRAYQFPFPYFWGKFAHAQTVYTRMSFLPTLIIADGLGTRLGMFILCLTSVASVTFAAGYKEEGKMVGWKTERGMTGTVFSLQ